LYWMLEGTRNVGREVSSLCVVDQKNEKQKKK